MLYHLYVLYGIKVIKFTYVIKNTFSEHVQNERKFGVQILVYY